MKVGDLVRCVVGYPWDHRPYLGLIMGFDEDSDPIVDFFDQNMVSGAYCITAIEVVNESR